ncbi:hypothetical protein, partial [Methyloglobulus sp.]|uniref:hypothetical protein n=1 Tax=Methyloglobulus sp. TaxID=2518622 RepID=UPI0039896B26
MGHNYYYRWRYANTIRTVWNNNGNPNVRPILTPLKAELTANENNPKPDQLNATRLLFGYTSDRVTDPLKQNGSSNIGIGDFQQLAGRIHINSAVEVLKDGATDNSRFLTGDQALALKPLGQPRPSAVEHYLTQPKPENLSTPFVSARLKADRKDGGQMLTYGDLPGRDTPSTLAGRKFYLHQPKAETDDSCYRATTDEHINGNLAMLARFVSKPTTDFRFTLRFKDLRPWELGALLVTLEPEKYLKATLIKLKDAKPEANYHKELNNIIAKLPDTDKTVVEKKPPLFAHKLGHARPLGFGSVQLKCDAIQLLTANAADKLPVLNAYKDSDKAITALAEKLAGQLTSVDHLEQWCAVHQYAGRTRSEYPNVKGNIFAHHSAIRTDHIKNRRLPETNSQLSGKLLKPLDFNPS